MSQVTIHGFAQSTYVWTARAICAAKGVEVDFQPFNPPAHKSEAHLARHPFGKVPAMEHGDFTLYETTAIARYIDETFDGPALTPDTAQGRARMEQWIGVVNSYLYPQAVPGLIFAYLFPGTPDGKPDVARIEATLPKLRITLAVFDDALEGQEWLGGEAPGLADYFFTPLLASVARLPEGGELVGATANLGSYLGRAMALSALRDTTPGGKG